MNQLDWNDIQYFVSLVNEQTLTATADIFGVQHSTVARRIDKLEKSLSVKLFDRLGKRYRLTAEGELLYTQASEIQSHVHSFSRMAISQNSMQGEVVISAPPVWAQEILVPYLSDFYQKFPHITLSLQGDIHQVNLYQKEADIAIRIGRPVEETLVIRKLMDIDYQLYAHPSWYNNVGSETLESGLTHFVELQASRKIMRWTNKLKQDYDVQTIFSSNDLYICHSVISQGLGVGVLPDILVKRAVNAQQSQDLLSMSAMRSKYFSKNHGKKFPKTADDFCQKQTFELYLVMHSDVRRSPRVKAVADWVSEVVAQHLGLNK